MGVFGLAPASVGMAGMTAYSVAHPVHEIGIRRALDARKGNVLALMTKEGTLLIAAGTSAGMALAWAAPPASIRRRSAGRPRTPMKARNR